jgi:DNA-binding transcriptional LysR family regulator
MDIQDMRIFARVAAVQNLSAVGIELGLTPGTISKRLQALEDELSARLFDRTTRSIRITEEGSTFLVHVERILSEIAAAMASVNDRVMKPKGTLKIAAPVVLGRRYIATAVCEFMHAYPEIEAHVDFKDGQVRLQEEGYDVSIRTGTLADSTLIAKRLAPDRQVIAASPSYLFRRGRPQRPEELAGHACLVSGDQWQWSFVKSGMERSVRIDGPLRSNDSELLCHAAIDGLGIVRASELEIAEELRSGKLVPVLGDYNVASNAAIWALYPSAKHVLPRLRVLLDFLADWFRDAKGEARGTDGAISADQSHRAASRGRSALGARLS